MHARLLSLKVGLFLGILFFFFAMVNGIVSFISLSDFSVLMYKNARDFCVLILYPVAIQFID